jgi:hypothetical protein
MSLSIDRIVASFRSDFARPNRFLVFFPLPNFPPSLEVDIYGSSEAILTFRCENAQIPGRTLATTEQRTYGPIEKFPYLTTYNDLDVTLIVDSDMKQKKLFDAWMQLINPSSTNNFNYRNTYCTDITVKQYDVTDKVTHEVRFIESYPISINQMDLDWSSDGYHKLNATFAYTRWETII